MKFKYWRLLVLLATFAMLSLVSTLWDVLFAGRPASVIAPTTSTTTQSETSLDIPEPTLAIRASGPVGQTETWQLVFNDEFEGRALDRSRWTVCYWWNQNGCTNLGNNELQWYTPDNVLVEGGILRLRAQKQEFETEDGQIYPYTSGMITTGPVSYDEPQKLGFAFQTGYAEIRARSPQGDGLWAAFWLLPTDLTSKPEIDVMEILGNAPDMLEMHIHYLVDPETADSSGKSWQGIDFSADWHTFAIDWRPDRVVWLVDGVERWRFEEQEYIPATNMYLLLNLAVGGDWPGPPGSDTVFPSYFEVDYVRVWYVLD
ncbi:MAG: glycoside hydrolase family 16 protein [Anaerolineae bacterium]|nr:glycoside hydrolase family 16 protein [Anaerolineae bacterium]